MRRIAIIGCGGSGKSTLAIALSVILNLPVYHLDRLYWQPGWQEMDKGEWRALQERLVRQPAWIMDGNYGGTLELRLAACDTVIFLDLPTLTCLWRVAARYLRYRGRSRPDMTPGCDERLNPTFVRWILSYRRTRRPGILGRLEALPASTTVIRLTSTRAIRAFLHAFTERPTDGN